MSERAVVGHLVGARVASRRPGRSCPYLVISCAVMGIDEPIALPRASTEAGGATSSPGAAV